MQDLLLLFNETKRKFQCVGHFTTVSNHSLYMNRLTVTSIVRCHGPFSSYYCKCYCKAAYIIQVIIRFLCLLICPLITISIESNYFPMQEDRSVSSQNRVLQNQSSKKVSEVMGTRVSQNVQTGKLMLATSFSMVKYTNRIWENQKNFYFFYFFNSLKGIKV